MKQKLHTSWVNLGEELGISTSEITKVWAKFDKHYSKSHRHYHNFEHLHHMFGWTEKLSEHIIDMPSIKLAIWFHDLIYNPLKKDNEIKSAKYARLCMTDWQLPKEQIEKVEAFILATTKHQASSSNIDEYIFLDIDLAILGSTKERYLAYITAIRKEYAIYPNILYKPGRKKVLQNFLNREFLYFTPFMREELASKARANLLMELGML